MATHDDLHRIALALPGAEQHEGDPAYRVGGKQFVWTWRERVDPRRTKVPRPDVLVLCVPDEQDKAALVAADPRVFFTEPHYDGHALVLVRLPEISVETLTEVVTDSWRCVAPPTGDS